MGCDSYDWSDQSKEYFKKKSEEKLQPLGVARFMSKDPVDPPKDPDPGRRKIIPDPEGKHKIEKDEGPDFRPPTKKRDKK